MAVYLFRLDLVDAELLSTEERRVEDRRSDLVAKVTPVRGESFYPASGNPERQRRSDGSADAPLLAERPVGASRLPGSSMLGLHRRRALTMASGLDGPQLRYQYEMVDMRDIDYRTLCDSQQSRRAGVVGDPRRFWRR
ncbi:MAG: hypothetical protein MZV65_36620 [Chromatiales bacterium]|nr:hypothetical protein [Chromatiales bacterium]